MFAQFSKSLGLLDECETRIDGWCVDSDEFKVIEELKTRKGAFGLILDHSLRSRTPLDFPEFSFCCRKGGGRIFIHILSLPRLSVNFHLESAFN